MTTDLYLCKISDDSYPCSNDSQVDSDPRKNLKAATIHERGNSVKRRPIIDIIEDGTIVKDEFI